jgi:Zn-dependent membrane protease YugP
VPVSISIVLLVVRVLFFTPHWWVRAVMRRYRQPRDDFSGTCGEFARHLLDRAGLKDVHVDVPQTGDHYGPRDRTVCLSAEKFDGRSLTAVVVAAHEAGHALQDAQSYPPLRWRHRLLGLANAAQQLGNLLIIGIPTITLVTRTTVSGLLAVAWPALVPPHPCTLACTMHEHERVAGASVV